MSLATCSFHHDNIMPALNPQCRGDSKDSTIMVVSNNQCSDKDENDERLRTVECLRGRLLAERGASKSAKEETEQLGKKLDELEKKLNKEIKIRNRAEKRLRRALKKLESLKILNLSESSIGSISSCSSLGNEILEEKRTSLVQIENDSLQCSSIEEMKEGKNGITRSRESFSSNSSIKGYSLDENLSLIGSEMSSKKGENHPNESSKDNGSEEESHNDERQQCLSNGTESESQEDEKIKSEENKLAIVLVNTDKKEEIRNEKTETKENVESVLLALREVREKLQYSIARRSISSMKEIYGR